jgi:hypothetical protein
MTNKISKILLIGADQNNSRDGVIVQGIRSLLDLFVKEYHTHYHFLNDHADEADNAIKDTDYTHIIISGTPWLWDQFHHSVKYGNLLKILNSQLTAKVMFCGIGSCIGLEYLDSEICEDDSHLQGMQDLFSRGVVICRDDIIQKKLNKAGVFSAFLPCPSFFCFLNKKLNIEKNENVLIWSDPEKLISACDWQEQSKLQNIYELCKFYAKQFHAKVYCAEMNDFPKALEIGLPEPILLHDWRQTLATMEKANHVLSGRVHCAVPAFVLGKPTSIIPFDSRHKVLENFGCPSSSNIENLTFSDKHFQPENYLVAYENLFKSFFDC